MGNTNIATSEETTVIEVSYAQPFARSPSIMPPSGVVACRADFGYEITTIYLTLELRSYRVIDLYHETGIPVRTIMKALEVLLDDNLVRYTDGFYGVA